MRKTLPMDNRIIRDYIINFYSQNRIMLKPLFYEKIDNGQVTIKFGFYIKGKETEWLKSLEEGFLL